MRTLTLVAAIGAFVPLNVATLHWNWGLGGVWAGLTAFIVVRLVRHGAAHAGTPLGEAGRAALTARW